jgi:hypothetical protein
VSRPFGVMFGFTLLWGVAVTLGVCASKAIAASEICGNGRDDDLDGLNDSADPDCMVDRVLRVRDDTFKYSISGELEGDVSINDVVRDAPGVYSVEGEGPAQGQVDLDPSTGRFRYRPAEGFLSGTDKFDYRLTDGNGRYGTATVTVLLQAVSSPLVTEAWELDGVLNVRGRSLKLGGPLRVQVGDFPPVTVRLADITQGSKQQVSEFRVLLPSDWQPGSYRLSVRNSLGSDAFEITLGTQGPAGPQGLRGPRGIGIQALLGKACPPGESVTGFTADGNLVCSDLGSGEPEGSAFEKALAGVTDTYLRDCIANAYPAAQVPEDVVQLSCSYIRQLDGLGAFTRVNRLYFQNNSFTGSNPLSPLSALTQLEFLGFADGTDIPSIEPLRGLPIREFSVDHLAEAGSVDVFNSWTQLEKLGIYYTGWSQFPVLSEERAAGIKVLMIQATQISDLSPITRMVNLEEFFFNYELVEDISMITAGNLPMLKKLFITGNRVADISSLSNFETLTDVNFAGNRISTIGNAFDGMLQGTVTLIGNPLLCSEYDSYMARKPSAVTFVFDRNTCIE